MTLRYFEVEFQIFEPILSKQAKKKSPENPFVYTKYGDYYLPDLDIPAQEQVPVNRYGQMHGNYLKKNNRTAYNELLFSGRLNRYLAELGEQAEKCLHC